MNAAAAADRPAPAWLLIALFLIAIWMPLLQMAFHLFPAMDTYEKRAPAVAPKPTLQGLPDFLPRYARYFRDHFGLRANLIHWDSVIRLKLLHKSSVSRLVFGRNGWIYYDSDVIGDGITIQDYRGLAPFSAGELRDIHDHLTRQARWCRERGIVYLHVIVPNKETIYPEYLPSSIRRSGPVTRLDQLVELARSDSLIHLIDLRPDLLWAKAQHPFPLYSRGGTHWNEYGAYYGYRRIVAELSRSFPGLRAYDVEDFTVTEDPRSAADHWLGLPENLAFRFAPKAERIASHPGPRIPKVVVLHDSFMEELQPFLALHADSLVARNPLRPRKGVWELVERERPDLLICQTVERYTGLVLRLPGP